MAEKFRMRSTEHVQSAATAVMALNRVQWQDVGLVCVTRNTHFFYTRCVVTFQTHCIRVVRVLRILNPALEREEIMMCMDVPIVRIGGCFEIFSGLQR